MAHAGGKVILFGEHAVVYGVPAIAAGIDRGATAVARHDAAAVLLVGETRCERGDGSDLGRAFDALLGALGADQISVDVQVQLPLGCGLGGSAAIAVATARAVLELIAPSEAGEDAARRRRVLDAATAWEQVFHGNPSGIDAAAAASGGCIWYEREHGPSALAVGCPLDLAIGVAGPPASTKEMVDSVARLKARRPEIVDKALQGIRALVRNARLCIESADVIGLGRLLDLNQMLLSGLHVSSEEIERACRLAREAGALGAKLTGAGGGGAVIALTAGDADAVLAAWQAQGIQGFAARVEATVGTQTGAPT